MSKTLSEQVAELEAERDRLKADAISDLTQRHWLEVQVRNREVDLCNQAFEHRQALEDAREENADLRAERDALPRVITADELREGQLICIHRGHSWGLRAIGTFVNLEGDLVTIKAGGDRTFTESVQFHTIVLLEDAPEPEPEIVTAETIRASEPGSVWRDRNGINHEWTGERLVWHPHAGGLGEDDFLTNGHFEADSPWSRSDTPPRSAYDAPAEDVDTSAPRLTVHNLGAVPGEGLAQAYNLWLIKREDGSSDD